MPPPQQQEQRLIYTFYDISGEKREYLYEPNKKLATWINRNHEDDVDEKSTTSSSSCSTVVTTVPETKVHFGRQTVKQYALYSLKEEKLEDPSRRLYKRRHLQQLRSQGPLLEKQSPPSLVARKRRPTTVQSLPKHHTLSEENPYHWASILEKVLSHAAHFFLLAVDLLAWVDDYDPLPSLEEITSASTALNILLFVSLSFPLVIPLGEEFRPTIECRGTKVEL